MACNGIIPKYGLTPVEIYGALFRRGVRHAVMGKGYYTTKPRVDLGDDMLIAYELTIDVVETSGGRD